MKLNRLEFIAMNNPVRAYIQEKYEIRILRSMTQAVNSGTVLEIGCGNGTGSRLIKKYFSPQRIIAIDLDERMIDIARNRNRDSSVTYRVMDALKLDFDNEQFDAAFDFGIIHHIADWKRCIRELKRVLKPGGELVLEDLSVETFTKGIGHLWRILSDHPYGDMYSVRQFTEYLAAEGFKIESFRESNPLGLVRFFSLAAKRLL